MSDATLFNDWRQALGFAGIPHAAHYRLIAGEWQNQQLMVIRARLAREGVDIQVRERNGRYEAWRRL